MALSASVVRDLVSEITTTTGTGAYVLAGASGSDKLTFASQFANGETFPYVTLDSEGGWEVGRGKYNSSGNTVSRDKVFRSSNANAAVSWAAGTKRVFCGLNSMGGMLTTQLHNLSATVVPTANDDAADGYGVGSLWLMPITLGGQLYICVDPTPAAAVWKGIAISDETNVWTGSRSFSMGGNANTATNTDAVSLGGNGNQTTGVKSAIVSGIDNTNAGGASGIFAGANNSITATSYASTILGGQNNYNAYNYSGMLGGKGNQNFSDYGVCLGGQGNSAGAYGARRTSVTVAGNYAQADHSTGDVLGGSADLTTPGRNQTERLCLGLQTTDATPTAMNLNGGTTEHVTIPAATCWAVKLFVTGTGATGAVVSAWEMAAVIRRNGTGAPAIVGSVSGTTAFAQDAGAAAWAATMEADAGNNALKVKVTGAAATTIQWTATLIITQVKA